MLALHTTWSSTGNFKYLQWVAENIHRIHHACDYTLKKPTAKVKLQAMYIMINWERHLLEWCLEAKFAIAVWIMAFTKGESCWKKETTRQQGNDFPQMLRTSQPWMSSSFLNQWKWLQWNHGKIHGNAIWHVDNIPTMQFQMGLREIPRDSVCEQSKANRLLFLIFMVLPPRVIHCHDTIDPVAEWVRKTLAFCLLSMNLPKLWSRFF